MKGLFLRSLLILGAVIFISACASDETTTSSDYPIKTGGTVPGEKSADDIGAATAGPGSAAAGVRW